jgi:dTDP-4-dehydrorhamnose 3,5-epimerase
VTPDGWAATAIEGALRRSLTAHADERGAFSELWRESWTAGFANGAFVQANLSRSKIGVLRGMHFHRHQWDLWIVLAGTATTALADLRDPGLHRGWRPPVDVFELREGDALLIPPRVAHGFYARADLELVYLVTNEYDSTDELGFAWDDPDTAIPWPMNEPIVSARDRSNPPLRALLPDLV